MALTPEQCHADFARQTQAEQRHESEFAAYILKAFTFLDGPQKERVIVAIANTYPKHTVRALESSLIATV